jgi:hypothetical protein
MQTLKPSLHLLQRHHPFDDTTGALLDLPALNGFD